MVEQFLNYIRVQNLFHSSERILLAVSGGADSMLMLNLFTNAGFSIAVAHCNFRLRGVESDGDEQFVTDYCDRHNLTLYVKHFNTEEYAGVEGISIEMAARDLRYEWFNALLDLHKFNFLATAHHQDDVIETFLINLARGTGIKGLSGIQSKSEKIIRPMLFTNRAEILSYCAQQNIEFRTDSSNLDTVFKRNLIRQEIIPKLEQINSAFRKNALKTIFNLNETRQLFKQKLNEIKAEVYSEDNLGVMIHIGKLLDHNPIRTILFELIREFGFQIEQVDEIIESLKKESGRRFFSDGYRLVKDREYILISPFVGKPDKVYYIDGDCELISYPLRLTMEKFDRSSEFRVSASSKTVDLDFDKLIFPLMLRHWQEGEYFQPLGMTGLKKLSDFFIDEKYSIPEKENAWILTSGNQVVWIAGKRIDDRFKISNRTKKIFRIRIK